MSANYHPIVGRIVAVYGASPGPASGITYDIEVDLPSIGLITLSNQRPSEERVWDVVGGEPMHVRAVAVGRGVNGTASSDRVWWWFRELPDMGPCDDQPGDGGNFLPIRLLPDVRPEPPPPPSGGSSDSVSAPDSGGLGEGGIA